MPNKKNKIKFHRRIYTEEAIKQSMDDCSHLGNFSINNSQYYYEITVENLEEIALNEFMNYALSLTKIHN